MKLAKYRIILKPSSNFSLPSYKGSTFRGGFGHTLKRITCQNNEKNCTSCNLRSKCIYHYIFETTISKEINGKQKHTELPHPFIIEPPFDRNRYYTPDDKILLNLILVGHAIDYIPHIIFAFEELGRIGIGKDKGRYIIEKVINICEDSEICTYGSSFHIKDECPMMDSTDLIKKTSQLNYQQITLNFLTPTRIKYQGKLIIDIDFEIIMKNLLRRLSWLAEIHCDEKWEMDWQGIISRAKEQVNMLDSNLHWYDWERYSQRQVKKMKMGGFVGTATFTGEISEFLPFLKLGEYLHIGKGTVYGLGKYEIKEE